jgi:hypothetical protein
LTDSWPAKIGRGEITSVMMMFLCISCNVANPINHPQSRKNLGRSGYKPVELPFDPFLASNLAICWDPDKFEPEAKLSTCGVLDDFGIFFHENHDLSEMGNWNPTPWRTQRV